MTGKCLLIACAIFLAARPAAAQGAAVDRGDRILPTDAAVRLAMSPRQPSSERLTFLPEPAPPAVTDRRAAFLRSAAELQSLIHSAGTIFSGQVIHVGRPAHDLTTNSAATTITFRVADAFRGAVPGETLTIREWSGLWARGERYRIGERVLLFLYPSSRLGFTSPVHGAMGRFEMNSESTITPNAVQSGFFSRQAVFSASAREAKGTERVSYAEFAIGIRRAIANAPYMGRSETK